MPPFDNANCSSESDDSSLSSRPGSPQDARNNLEIKKTQQSFLIHNKELKAAELLLIAAQKRRDDSAEALEQQKDERDNLLISYEDSKHNRLVKDQVLAPKETVKATNDAPVKRVTRASKKNGSSGPKHPEPSSAAKVGEPSARGFYVEIPLVKSLDDPAQKRIRHEEPIEELPSPSSPLATRSNNSGRGLFKPRRWYGGKLACKFMGSRAPQNDTANKKEAEEEEAEEEEEE